jgi:hypothetical protein
VLQIGVAYRGELVGRVRDEVSGVLREALRRGLYPPTTLLFLSLSIVSANITTWQYTTMRDGLVANMDLITTTNHMHMSNGLVVNIMQSS